ncbi:MAG: hypothetical protein KBT67_10230 [bacterium]|nr:hypothetical protein [Candidatus Limimorpha caballi]
MKKSIRLFTTLMVCMAMALCVSCKKDEKVYVAKVQAETPEVTTTARTADISGTYNYVSTMKSVVIVYGEDASLSSPQKVTAKHTRDSYSVTINDLEPSTKYYYYCIFDTGYGAAESEQWSFTTQATVTTAQVSDIAQTTATCGGNVTSNGSVAVTARGVCWSTSPNPTVSDSHTSDGSGTGSFTSSITGLTANTTYYVRAYATNSAGTSYGEQKNFTTQTTPTVTTSSVSNITQTTATCGGNVTSDGGATVTARGVCWSTSQNPTVSDSHTTDGSGTGSFTSSITGLTANTKYYVRAYATNSAGTSYGEQRTFTTQSGGGTQTVPTVTTAQVSNITQTTATCGGEVTSDGGAAVTARGVCWSTSQNPTVSDSHTTDGTGTGSFTSSITGLTANTTYYVRAYATNSAGTSYGEQESFTTLQSISVPTVTTSQVSNITQTTATCGGNVTSDGGATVTARGVCWSTSQNPTVSDSHTTDGSGTGSFTSSITGLTASTTYYVRAYATNSAGTSYGEQRIFTTPQNITSPTVTTNNVTDITQTTATCGGSVTSDGGAAVTVRGVCWSTSQNPTVSNSHSTDGSGTGSFTSSITGLTASTTYYVRAYATNSAGTSYGEQRTFTTQGGGGTQTTPTVTTSQVSNITQTTATCGGNVTSDGGAAVTARGVCWSTSQNPTVSNSHTTDGSGTGSFTSSITGLTANTTYYVRAYATNSAGTSYGEQRTFTTQSGGGTQTVPTVTTVQVSNITQTTATCGGNVTSDGGAAVTARGVCWSTSSNPTVSNSHTTDGSGTGSFTSSITGLTASTTYYVRAYATNSAGTSYGEQESFTTQSGGGTSGCFSVSSTTTVEFAPGNLYWDGSAFRFEANQWSFADTWNASHVSHFKWSDAANAVTGDQTYSGDLFCASNFTVTGDSHTWRTLSKDEWVYLIGTRPGNRFAKARVSGVQGLLIFPDNYSGTTSGNGIAAVNTTNAAFPTSDIPSATWTSMESAGVVFLPAAGYRYGTSLYYVGSYGFYWSSSCGNSTNAHLMNFNSDIVYPQNGSFSRYYGPSVRLVR